MEIEGERKRERERKRKRIKVYVELLRRVSRKIREKTYNRQNSLKKHVTVNIITNRAPIFIYVPCG